MQNVYIGFPNITGRILANHLKAHLPSSILDFLKSSPTSPNESPLPRVESQKPPRKRIRTSTSPPIASKDIKPIQYVVLRWTTINITFPRNPKDIDPNIHCQKTKPFRVSLSRIDAQKFKISIEYFLTSDDEIQRPRSRGGPKSIKLLETELDAEDLPLRDVELAMLTDIHWFRKTGQGKLFTETSLILHRRDGSDHLALSLAIKWEKTETLLHVPAWLQKRHMLQKCLDEYFPGLSDDEDGEFLHTPQAFYKCANIPDKDDPIALSLRTPAIEADLYPFQKRAVQWLLQREGVQWSSSGRVTAFEEKVEDINGLPPSFTKVVDDEGTEFFFSSQMNLATTNIAPFRNSERKLLGGILAEEMGLGKTLEIISLITLHQSPLSGLATETPDGILPIRATLLVVPSSLLSQWMDEIDRHSPSLRVLHYAGFKNGSSSSFEELRQIFAVQDIVITTYDVLSSEIHFSKPAPERIMRQARKYERATSPLPKCLFWRVCLDEAQMIHGSVSAASQVAIMIPRINAWCISGTPVKRGIADLHGLLIFLKYEPYASNFNLWSHLLHSPKSFARCFNKIALRHTKKLVRDELQLPPQKRVGPLSKSILLFKHFY